MLEQVTIFGEITNRACPVVDNIGHLIETTLNTELYTDKLTISLVLPSIVTDTNA